MAMIFLGKPGEEKKEYELKVTHKVLKRFSQLRQCDMDQLDGEILKYDGVACMMYCMLTRVDGSLTSDVIDEMLDDVPLIQIIDVCTAAINEAFPHKEDAEEAEGEDGPLAGKNSGAEG